MRHRLAVAAVLLWCVLGRWKRLVAEPPAVARRPGRCMSDAVAGRPGSELAAPALRVDVTSPVPPYEQLREQIAGLIATGLLQAARLPRCARSPPISAWPGARSPAPTGSLRRLAWSRVAADTERSSGQAPGLLPVINPASGHCPPRPITLPASRVTSGLATMPYWP